MPGFRAKKMEGHLLKLNKYFEAVNSKKQQRNELSITERPGGLNLKMGTAIHRNPPDVVTQRVEDQAKNTAPNRRVRTPRAEIRAEYRSNGLARQPLAMGKYRDMLKDSGHGSDLVEEKIRRVAGGGEGWDKKMRRKRSGGTTFTRHTDIDGDLKRPLHHKISNESGLQSCDAHSSRLSTDEDNHIVSPSPVTKGKASRAPQSGHVTAANCSPNNPHVSGAPESWEPLSNVNKIHSIGWANNRKRAMPSGSSAPPMAQWGGQRPQKISRTRRANLVSPVSNLEEMQISPEGCSPSDFGTRINSSGMKGALRLRGVANGTHQLKLKRENVLSPDAKFPENEETGAGGTKLKESVMGSVEVEEKAVNAVPDSGSSLFLTKKEKSLIKEEVSDGVQRQGHSGRGSSFASMSPVREKLENTVTTKPPLRSTRPGSDKNGSKTGRPLKKLLDRKGFSCSGHMPNSGSPDATEGIPGESDDDCEELLAAANLACQASYHACSSLFWRKLEPIFAPASLQDISYFSQQAKFAEELHGSLSQGDLVHEKIPASNKVVSGEIDRGLQNQIESKESARMAKFPDQIHDFDAACRKLDSERRLKKVTPLYQRVLSALIVEDEIEDFEENGTGRNVPLPYGTNADAKPRKRDAMDFDGGSTFGTQTWKQCAGNRFFSCNGSTTSGRSPVIKNRPENDLLLQGKIGYGCSDFGVLDGLSGNDLDGTQIVETNSLNISSSVGQYEKMCMEDKLVLELQSLGIYAGTVPNLDDREDEEISQDNVQLKNGLHQQIGRKKACLDNFYKAIQQGKEAEARELEQVAMDKLVELAYKKLLATQGSIASKYRFAKVSKQAALAFTKRTLARCRTFEDYGTTCFNEPALRGALFAAPPRGNEAEPSTCDGLGVGNRSFRSSEWHDLHRGSLDPFEKTRQSDHAFAKSGQISNRGKRKEVLLDDVGGIAALRPTSTLGSTLLGGTKGKRSARERDKDVSSRNIVAKAGRPSWSNLRGERKSKAKPKQKTAQLSTSEYGFVNKYTEATHPVHPSAISSGDLVTNGRNSKRELGLRSPGTIPQDLLKDTKEAVDFMNLQLPDSDSIDELGVGSDLGGHQDLCSWLNFDEDGLQDHDSEGLAIPMDDLTELGNVF